MHDIAGVSVTVATILVATFFSNQAVNTLRTELSSLRSELRAEINSLRAEMIGKLDSIQKDMRDLYAEQARQDLRISNLEQQQK